MEPEEGPDLSFPNCSADHLCTPTAGKACVPFSLRIVHSVTCWSAALGFSKALPDGQRANPGALQILLPEFLDISATSIINATLNYLPGFRWDTTKTEI